MDKTAPPELMFITVRSRIDKYGREHYTVDVDPATREEMLEALGE